MAAYATVTFNIPDQATAQAICNAICPGAGLNLSAAKAAVIAWITQQVQAQQEGAAQQAALATVVTPTPIALS
jgi:hypothetical protein